jgi:PAS domain S-box-containing protein
MSSDRLLWIGYSGEPTENTVRVLEETIDGLAIQVAVDGREALDVLARDPGRHLLVVIDARSASIDLSTLVAGIKQINPAIEMIILGQPGLHWRALSLPKFYRPVLLSEAPDPDTVISCVAKLREMVESKQDYFELNRVIGNTVGGMSRRSTEALLRLLSRQNIMGMIGLRRDGFFSAYNTEAERLTGYSASELAHIQVWCQTLLPDYDSVRALLAAIERYWAEGTGRENLQLRIQRKEGRLVTLSATMLVMLDNLSQARQMVLLFFDPLESWRVREYQALMDSDYLGLYTYLPRSGFVRISPAALRLLNRAFGLRVSEEDVLHRRISDLPLPAKTAEAWQERLHRVAAGEVGSAAGFFPLGLPGMRVMEHVLLSRVQTGAIDQYAVLAAVAPTDDIPAETAEEGLGVGLAARTLEAIPRSCVAFRCVRDESGFVADFEYMSANSAARETLAMGPEIRPGVGSAAVFRDELARSAILTSAREVVETGEQRRFETWMVVRPDGDARLMRFWLGKVGDGAVVFFHDVTAVRQEEQQLTQYRHVFAHMQEAIIVTDLDGNVVDWNPASENMFGYSRDQIVGKSVFLLARKAQGDRMEEDTRNFLREGDVWKGEYEFVRQDGSVGVAFTAFALLKDDQDIPYGTVGLCHDLTRRKRVEEMLTVKSQELQEKNLALNTLLRHAEAERIRACEQMAADLARRVTERVHRILEERKRPELVEAHANLLLQELGLGPETKVLDPGDPRLKLSEKELEVARLIRLGKTTEEVAFILDKSPDTIRLQRISIRKKLGIDRRDRNLAAYLKQIDLT